MARIERLLKELRYEVERGMMEGEIHERIGYRFIIPRSKELPVDGVVLCQFETRPTPAHYVHGLEDRPGLKLVE